MLAQNFQTPAALEISDAEFEVLVKVLGMLERQEIPEQLFDMYRVGNPECGTPGCIMGWGQTIMKKFGARPFPDNLCNLVNSRHDVTTAQAAIALRNYLTHGKPRWAEALAD